VAAERVAVYGGLLRLPKNSVFPIYSELHLTLKQEQKVADVCQNQLFSLLVERYPSVATHFYRTINLTVVSPGIYRESAPLSPPPPP